MRVFFTSDTHFSHARVIEYSKRPFADAHEMNKALTDNWNAVVKPEDVVYHLGDFALAGVENACAILRRLNGTKHLVAGNHDRKLLRFEAFRGSWASVAESGLAEIIIQDQGKALPIVLCHFALRTWNRSHYGSWNLHGHSHGTLPDDPRLLQADVGVDCWDYRPVSVGQLRQRMAQKKWEPVDRHGRQHEEEGEK